MKTTFIYNGSTKENHFEVISLGRMLGCQNVRKMSIGERIAELANNGNERAVEICENNGVFFSKI